MIVNVTQRDIDKSRLEAEGSGYDTCPIARALRRKFSNAIVTPDYIRIGGGRNAEVPERVRKWIEDYDFGRDVKPIRFRLTI